MAEKNDKDKKKEEKKDPFDEIMDILSTYEEGMDPRSTKEYEN